MIDLKLLYKGKQFYTFAIGECLALGVAYRTEIGFLSIATKAFLGWVYIGYKVAQGFWPI
jgi:hypothetical protein